MMVYILLALLALPVLSLVLSLIKVVLKLSFPVAKIMLLLLAVWLVVGFATGGLQETISHLGKPYVSQDEQGVVNYTGCFSEGTLDLSTYTPQNKLLKAKVNCALSKVTIKVPQNCVLRISGHTLLSQVKIGENGEFVTYKKEDKVFGSGDTILELTLNSGAAMVEIIH